MTIFFYAWFLVNWFGAWWWCTPGNLLQALGFGAHSNAEPFLSLAGVLMSFASFGVRSSQQCWGLFRILRRFEKAGLISQQCLSSGLLWESPIDDELIALLSSSSSFLSFFGVFPFSLELPRNRTKILLGFFLAKLCHFHDWYLVFHPLQVFPLERTRVRVMLSMRLVGLLNLPMRPYNRPGRRSSMWRGTWKSVTLSTEMRWGNIWSPSRMRSFTGLWSAIFLGSRTIKALCPSLSFSLVMQPLTT